MKELKEILLPTKERLRSKQYYDELAGNILTYSIVGLDRKPRKITAIEFYFYHEKHWPDEAAHRHEMQLTCGNFYVHHAPKFRAPNYAGIDIAWGNRDGNIYGGILIRELDHRDGSGLAIRALIRGEKGLVPVPSVEGHPLLKWSGDEKELLEKIHGSSVFDVHSPVHLIKALDDAALRFSTRKRVGIDGKNYADMLLNYYIPKFDRKRKEI